MACLPSYGTNSPKTLSISKYDNRNSCILSMLGRVGISSFKFESARYELLPSNIRDLISLAQTGKDVMTNL